MRAYSVPQTSSNRPWAGTVKLALCVLILLLGSASSGGSSALAQASDGPLAVDASTNLSCRPVRNTGDKVEISWLDENDWVADAEMGPEFEVLRQNAGGGAWQSLGTVLPTQACTDDYWALDESCCKSNGWCRYVANKSANNMDYRFKVRATDGGESTDTANSCREPTYLDEDSGVYRVYYRPYADEGLDCPQYEVDGDLRGTCTDPATNGSGDNAIAAQLLNSHVEYRDEYTGQGFNDPGTYDGGIPFPIDLFPCNNGCAGGRGIQIPPETMADNADYNPATGSGYVWKIMVMGHEVFHKIQGAHGGGGGDPFYKWLIEGQARGSEDTSCIYSTTPCALWDNGVAQYWEGETTGYLGQPQIGLQEQSYRAAPFWRYVMEQYGDTADEPRLGMDVMLKFWEQNEANGDALKDGIDTLDQTLPLLLNDDGRRFEDLWKDFAVLLYAKEFIDHPAPASLAKYNLKDEDDWNPASGTKGSFGPVKLTKDVALLSDAQVNGIASMDAWGARYFRIVPDPSVPVVQIAIESLTAAPLYVHVLGIDDGGGNAEIIDQWSGTGKSFAEAVDNTGPQYEEIGVVVAALDQAANFDYSFNRSEGIEILDPLTAIPVQAGDPNAPGKILLKLQYFGASLDPQPVADPLDLQIDIGNHTVAAGEIIQQANIQDQHWVVLRAPSDAQAGNCALPVGGELCDLVVTYKGFSDGEPMSVQYGPDTPVDNMLIIDRSGSMLGQKIESAKGAGRMVIDVYDTGDKIGVVSYSATPKLEASLKAWTNNSSQDAQDAIEDMDLPDGATATGAALAAGLDALDDKGDASHDWAMLLLSDGQDTVADEGDHIPAFLDAYAARKDDGDKLPRIHVVAVGDDADGLELQTVSDKSGGSFHFLPEGGGGAVLGAASLAGDRDPAPEGGSGDSGNSEVSGGSAQPAGLAGSLSMLSPALAEVYRVMSETILREQQVYAAEGSIALQKSNPRYHDVWVDGAASEAIFTVKYAPAPTLLAPDHRVIRPGGAVVKFTDPDVKIHSAYGHTIWRIAAPAAGKWRMDVNGCQPEGLAANSGGAGSGPADEHICATSYLAEAAVVSELTMEAFLGLAPADRKRGIPMPLFVSLSDTQGIPGATVKATVQRTGELITLHDDGAHDDGAAGDGFYGGLISDTALSGGYQVVIDAEGNSPMAGAFVRRGRLSFFLPFERDSDRDRLPDDYENEHACLRATNPDADRDPDADGLNNGREYLAKTDPCDPDTDDGGESDGSEVNRGANPLQPRDDGLRPPRIKAWPLPGKVQLRYSLPPETQSLRILRAGRRLGLGSYEPVAELPIGRIPTTQWQDEGLVDGRSYCYIAIAVGTRMSSAPSDPSCATPRQDPHAPKGEIEIEQQDPRTDPKLALLHLIAYDDPELEEHPAFDGALITVDAKISGVADMQLADDSEFPAARWEPFQPTKGWTLQPRGGKATVFVRYRDLAGNVSPIYSDSVDFPESAAGAHLYLDPSPAPLAVGETIDVELRVRDVQALYGGQIDLSFDPALVEIVDLDPSRPGAQIEPGDFPRPDDVLRNAADNTTGRLAYYFSLQGDKPGVSGSGRIARLRLRGKLPGTSPLGFTQAVLSDPQSVEIPASERDGQVIVLDDPGASPFAVEGRVVLERRLSDAGAEVCAGQNCSLTDLGGHFRLEGLSLGQRLEARHASYLRSTRLLDRAPDEAGGVLELPEVQLLAGDVVKDDRIYVSDAGAIGLRFNLDYDAASPDPAWLDAADVNDDDRVNILDMTAVKFNFRSRAPTAWTGLDLATTFGDLRGRLNQALGALGLKRARSQSARVYFDPQPAQIGVGEEIEIELRAEGLERLYSFGMRIAFNPAIVEVVDFSPIEEGIQMSIGDFLDPLDQFVLANDAENALGHIDFAMTQTRPASAKSGAGLLGTLRLRGKSAGTSALGIADLSLSDDTLPLPQAIAASAESGNVDVIVRPEAGALRNISTRGFVGTGDQVMIGGFIVSDAATEVIIRAIGPDLTRHGVPGVLADPVLQLYRGSDVILENDNWGDSPQAAAIAASALKPADPRESMIIATLEPGAYTAIVRGQGGSTGIALVEVFKSGGEGLLANISTRSFVRTGDAVMIGGFIVGEHATDVIIRAIGPDLARRNVPGVLADPTLQIYSGQSLIAENDNWGSSTQIAEIIASPLKPADPRESMWLARLEPGPYTAIVRGVGGTEGIGLVEVFRVRP